MKHSCLKTKQQGMTLLEIMIAMLIGLFLLGGVLQIFINSNRSYRMQDNLSRMQENGRFAMEFISRDLRMADYRACFSNAPVAGAVAGANNVAPVLPLTASTDSITIIKGSNACTDTNAACVVDACSAACIAPGPGGCGPNPTTTTAYSILQDASGEPALFKGIDGAAAQAQIEGVENMQILYGEDTDANGTPNYYVDSNTVVNMNNVVSVRITLTTRTINNRLTKTGDGRLRQIYTSTIGVRNRL